MERTYGQIAYEAYCWELESVYLCLAPNVKVTKWEDLDPVIKVAWHNTANCVLNAALDTLVDGAGLDEGLPVKEDV